MKVYKVLLTGRLTRFLQKEVNSRLDSYVSGKKLSEKERKEVDYLVELKMALKDKVSIFKNSL